MEIKNHKLIKVVIPSNLIFNGTVHKLTKVSKKFIIKGFTVKTVNGKIDSLFLNDPHPNADPRTGEFCIPHKLRQVNYNAKAVLTLLTILGTFNLDDCYFTPWTEIEYKRAEVIVD